MTSRVVLITGCSSGFGCDVAVDLSRTGFRVIATMRNMAKRGDLDDAAAAAGVSIDVVQLDVTDPASIAACVEAVRARYGRIDALINNAGFSSSGYVYDASLEEYRAQMETNFFGLVAVTKAVLPAMIEQRAGRIIQLSSLNGRVGFPVASAYSASKFAVEGFSQALRFEAKPFGVWVSVVEPGGFRTRIRDNRQTAAAFGDPASPFAPWSKRYAEVYEELFASRPGPAPVVRTIRRVLCARRPRFRYLVGSDARLAATLHALWPSLLEWYSGRMLRPRG